MRFHRKENKIHTTEIQVRRANCKDSYVANRKRFISLPLQFDLVICAYFESEGMFNCYLLMIAYIPTFLCISLLCFTHFKLHSPRAMKFIMEES